MTPVQEIVKNKPYLAWPVRKPSGLSDEAVFEQILNYGDWDDFNKFLEIKGLKESARIFYRALKKGASKLTTGDNKLLRALFQKVCIRKS